MAIALVIIQPSSLPVCFCRISALSIGHFSIHRVPTLKRSQRTSASLLDGRGTDRCSDAWLTSFTTHAAAVELQAITISMLGKAQRFVEAMRLRTFLVA
jgi:hypothetical protein